MKKLLLTGFEPFLDFPVNPTMKIVEELDGERINGYQVVGKIMAVDFSKSGQQILTFFEEVRPNAVISLGLAGGRHKITPERIAINCNDGARDNTGNIPKGEKIIEGGPDGIFSTLPVSAMAEALNEAGYPAEISNTAGTYLCNHVMYQMLYYLQTHSLDVPSGFIHIPASFELAIQHGKIPGWPNEQLKAAVRRAVECL
ncbi:MAG TPA: pyroglutamyl-peptidase I [Bacillaceae bacterium]